MNICNKITIVLFFLSVIVYAKQHPGYVVDNTLCVQYSNVISKFKTLNRPLTQNEKREILIIAMGMHTECGELDIYKSIDDLIVDDVITDFCETYYKGKFFSLHPEYNNKWKT